MSDLTADIIKRIKEGVEQKGEFELLLIDQMQLAKDGLDPQVICEMEGWTLVIDNESTIATIKESPSESVQFAGSLK